MFNHVNNGNEWSVHIEVSSSVCTANVRPEEEQEFLHPARTVWLELHVTALVKGRSQVALPIIAKKT